MKVYWASLVAQTGKGLSAMQETQVQSLGWEDPLEKEMAVYSSILAWKISWIAEPGKLPSMGSQSRTQLSDLTHSLTCDHYSILSCEQVWVGEINRQ